MTSQAASSTMVVEIKFVFVLTVLFLNSGVAQDLELTMNIISAGSNVVSAGQSLVGLNIYSLVQGNDGARVKISIEVENWTKYILIDPEVYLKQGLLTTPPRIIMPGMKEVMVVRGQTQANLLRNSEGLASWTILTSDANHQRVVFKWFAPGNFKNILKSAANLAGNDEDDIDMDKQEQKSNQLGVAVLNIGSLKDIIDVEKGKPRGSGDDIKMQNYWKSITPVIQGNEQFRIVGVMGSDHTTVIRLIVIPIKENDFHDKIREHLRKHVKIVYASEVVRNPGKVVR